MVQVTQSRISDCENYRSHICEPIKTFRLHKDQQLKRVRTRPDIDTEDSPVDACDIDVLVVLVMSYILWLCWLCHIYCGC